MYREIPGSLLNCFIAKLEFFEKRISPVSENLRATQASLYQIYSGSNEVISSDEKSSFRKSK